MSNYPLHQVKIFVGFNHVDVEKEANEWFRANLPVCIFEITYSRHQNGEHTIFIEYDPCEENEECEP
jgi:hypothetical protein